MRSLPDRLMTAEEFHDWHERQEGKFELYEGRVVPRFGWNIDDEGRWTMMAGARVVHNRVARNVLSALSRKLAGQGCEAFGSDAAIRTGPKTVRYPDVSVICDAEELAAIDDDTVEFTRPGLIVEVLSPSTERFDRGDKLREYRDLPSVRAVVLIDPVKRWMELYERRSEREWRNLSLLAGAALTITDPAVTLTPDDVFGES